MKSIHIPRNLRGFTIDDLTTGDRFNIGNIQIEIIDVVKGNVRAVALNNLFTILNYTTDNLYNHISCGKYHSYQKLECYAESVEQYIDTTYQTVNNGPRHILHIIDDVIYIATPQCKVVPARLSKLKDHINRKVITLTKTLKNVKEIRTVADVNTRKRRGVAIISSSTRQIAGGSRPAGNATTAYHKQKRVEGAKISGNIIIT